MERALYRPEEVAEVLSVGGSTVYAAIRDGRLESLKIGSSRRVPAGAIERFVERLREEQSVT